MKIHTVILYGVLATGATSAHAADLDPPLPVQAAAAPGKARAEVKAETLRALAAGEVSFGDTAYPKPATTDGVGLPRTAVKSDLLRAIAAHDYQFSDSAYPDSGIVTRPRTKVHAKAVAAMPASGMPGS